MLIDGASARDRMRLKADICIIGAGVAGITLANELKAYFPRVVVLESGGDSYDEKIQELNEAEKADGIHPDPVYSRLRVLGGTSNHWLNNAIPFSKIDFEKRAWIENSGWPISYGDVEKYYPKAGVYCGVDADGYDPEYWLKRLGLESPFSRSGIIQTKIAKAARPPTRFFQKYGPDLERSDQIDIYKHSNLVDVVFDKKTQQIREASFTSDGKVVHSIVADTFILCMGGIENARMLLHFNLKYGNALGNQHDNVGRYFMDHPTVRPASVFTTSPELAKDRSASFGERNIGLNFEYSEGTLRDHKITNAKLFFFNSNNYDLSDGISSFHILKDNLIKGELPDDAFTHLSNLIFDIDMVAEAISRKSFNKRIFPHAEDLAGFGVHVMMEQTPSRNNRVRLGQAKDRLGLRKVLVDWTLEQHDIDMMWAGLLLLGKEFGVHSLGRLRLLKEQSERMFADQMGFGHHHMGTTRMASDERTGVVDRNQLVFGTTNLYVAGSSVFTTGSHVPPTLTIVALSLRLADHLAMKKGKQ